MYVFYYFFVDSICFIIKLHCTVVTVWYFLLFMYYRIVSLSPHGFVVVMVFVVYRALGSDTWWPGY